MLKKKLSIPIIELEDFSELDNDEKILAEKAINVAKNAYAPYSEFNVGAAVLLEDGDIITGSNQENAAYPSGLCAERVALFYAGAIKGKVAPKIMAIAALNGLSLTDDPVTPCGACRQVFAEIETRYSKSFSLLLIGKKKIIKIKKAEYLLPLAFKS